MNGIGRLSSQILAAKEATGVAVGPKSGGASGAHFSENRPADFGGHLADLVQREVHSNVLDGNKSDSGSSTAALARQDFSSAAKPAETIPYSAGISILDPSQAKPRDLTVPSAAMIESRPGSNVVAARADMLFAGCNSPTFREPDNGRGPKPGIRLGAGAAMPSVHSLPAGFEKPIRKTNSLGDSPAHSSANRAVLATVSTPNPRQLMPGNGSLPPVSANETSLLVAGVLVGAVSKASRPDLVPAAAGENGSRVTHATGQTSPAETGSFQRFGTERLDLEESFFVDPNWDRDLDIASLVPVRVTAVGQETHLAPAKELSRSGQITALSQPSSPAGEAGSSMVPAENLLQAANLDRDAAYVHKRGKQFPTIPVEPDGSHGSLLIPSVRASASAGNERGDLLSATALLPAGTVPASSEPSTRASLVAGSTIPNEDLTQPANNYFAAAGAQLLGNEVENISPEQKKSHGSLLIPSVRASASAGNERGDLLSATALSPAGTIPASSEPTARANLVAGSTIPKQDLTQPANQGLEAADPQLRENYLASVSGEPTGVRDAGEISPVRVPPSAVHEPAHPVSAKLLSLAMQIANSIAAPADFGGSGRDRIGAQTEPAIQRAEETLPSASRIQILHLQLEPENLGKVTVKMRLAGPNLELQVEADRPETVRLIGNDKELLSGKLQSAGYAIDTLVIRTGDSQAPQPGLAAGTGASQDQHAGHSNGGPTAHDRPSMREDNSHSRPILEDDGKDANRIRAADGELYL